MAEKRINKTENVPSLASTIAEVCADAQAQLESKYCGGAEIMLPPRIL